MKQMIKMNAPIAVLLISIGAFFPYQPVDAQSTGREQLMAYVHTLAKKDSGYGWPDQYDSHLTPTFAAIGILRAIHALPDTVRRQELTHFLRTHHPQFGGKAIPALTYKQQNNVTYLGAKWRNTEAGSSGSVLRDLIYQQIQAIQWLGGDASPFAALVRLWKSQAGNIGNYEQHGYPVLYQEMMTPVCRQLLHIPLSDADRISTYLRSRRRRNGSFNNAPARDGGDGNILNTYWSLRALDILKSKDPQRNETVQWLQACQRKSGGFTHQPDPQIGANTEVIYTWAAVKALDLLSAQPAHLKACIRYLLSLRNADGGFGNRPGLPSTPMSTYYAVDALQTLGADTYLDQPVKAQQPPSRKQPFSGLQVYSVQFEAPGTGSPAEAVLLADSLHIQLWGCKNGPGPAWVARAQQIADAKKVPVTFFRADEPYGQFVHIKGMGSFGHILDFMAPAKTTLPSMGNDPSWAQYHASYVRPLLNDGGALLLQISNNEPLARILLDESIANGGYAAISTIHFTQNFLFFLPYLYQYRYQLPFVALEDAHGTQSWWWTDDLLHYRTLFLAKAPTYEAMMEALKNNWVVAVRHDSLSGYQTRMLGGAAGVQQYMRAHRKQWKWWGSEPDKLRHPWAAVTVVQPADTFEAGRPEEGINIRVRCWWHAGTAGLQAPVVQLQQMQIDNQPVTPRLIKKEDSRKRLTDSYYLYHLPNPAAGRHTVSVTLTRRGHPTTKTLTQTFRVDDR